MLNKIILSFILFVSLNCHANPHAHNLVIKQDHGQCHAYWQDQVFDCTIGQKGLALDKVEGDFKTPIGEFNFRKIYYRTDNLSQNDLHKLQTSRLELLPIAKDDGWCDDPTHALYNQYVKLPFDGSHERLYLDSYEYDLLITIGHNDEPAIPGKGSAVFIHVKNRHNTGTAGCVGLSLDDLLTVATQADENSKLVVIGSSIN